MKVFFNHRKTIKELREIINYMIWAKNKWIKTADKKANGINRFDKSIG